MIARVTNPTSPPATVHRYDHVFLLRQMAGNDYFQIVRFDAGSEPDVAGFDYMFSGEGGGVRLTGDEGSDVTMSKLVDVFNFCYSDTPVKKFENATVARRRVYKALCERWGYLPANPTTKEKEVTTAHAEDPKAAKAAERAAKQEKIKAEREAKAAQKSAAKAAKPARAPKAAASEPRVVGKPAKQPSETSQMREGTRRQRLLAMMDGTRALAEIAAAEGCTPALANSHIHCIWRDCGVGYGTNAEGRVVAHYPRGLSYEDFIKRPEQAKA